MSEQNIQQIGYKHAQQTDAYFFTSKKNDKFQIEVDSAPRYNHTGDDIDSEKYQKDSRFQDAQTSNAIACINKGKLNSVNNYNNMLRKITLGL